MGDLLDRVETALPEAMAALRKSHSKPRARTDNPPARQSRIEPIGPSVYSAIVTATPLAGHQCSSHQGASKLLLALDALDQRRKLRLMGLRIATAKKAVSKSIPMIVAKIGSQLPVAS